MALLEIRNLSKTYASRNRRGTATPVLDGMEFTVEEGEFFTIVGPSGAGKTTLLRCISGLSEPTSGEVLLSGKAIEGPPRQLAPVFQDYSRSLYPWLTVAKNVALPLEASGESSTEVARRVDQALTQVGLAGEDDKYPWQLSGGMQQRVAIARALAYEAELLVLDEPFAAVDAQTRADLEDLLLRVRDETGATFLFVTHDVDEAVYLSDRVAVVSKSPSRVEKIVTIDLPRERSQLDTKAIPRFGELRAEVFATIRHLVVEPQPEPEYII